MITRHRAVLELLRALGHNPDVVTEVVINHQGIEVAYLDKDGDEDKEYHFA